MKIWNRMNNPSKCDLLLGSINKRGNKVPFSSGLSLGKLELNRSMYAAVVIGGLLSSFDQKGQGTRSPSPVTTLRDSDPMEPI